MEEYLKKWSYKRVLQLSLGVFFIYYYTEDTNTIALLFGILMLSQAILNIGCFSTKGCDNSTNETDKQDFAKKIKKIK